MGSNGSIDENSRICCKRRMVDYPLCLVFAQQYFQFSSASFKTSPVNYFLTSESQLFEHARKGKKAKYYIAEYFYCKLFFCSVPCCCCCCCCCFFVSLLFISPFRLTIGKFMDKVFEINSSQASHHRQPRLPCI